MSSKEAPAHLHKLLLRGLVERQVKRKGFVGGSLWRLSSQGVQVLVAGGRTQWR
jgi:predicted DNA-binding transcriptional regulator